MSRSLSTTPKLTKNVFLQKNIDISQSHKFTFILSISNSVLEIISQSSKHELYETMELPEHVTTV